MARHASRRTTAGHRRSRRRVVAAIVVTGAVVLAGCETTPTSVAPPDPASLVIDRLIGAFNAEDIDGVEGVFGDEVVYVFHDTGEELVGPEATAFFQGYFGRETGQRVTEPFHAPDGRAYFLSKFEDTFGSRSTVVFDVEMDGEQLVSMGDRLQGFEEVFAAGDIDRLHEAFNDQDVDGRAEEFEGLTYRSPGGGEFTGADAAAHWEDSFGSTVTRTSGVFAIGPDAFGFVVERRDPGSGRSTTYSVEAERSGGRFTSMTERPIAS